MFVLIKNSLKKIFFIYYTNCYKNHQKIMLGRLKKYKIDIKQKIYFFLWIFDNNNKYCLWKKTRTNWWKNLGCRVMEYQEVRKMEVYCRLIVQSFHYSPVIISMNSTTDMSKSIKFRTIESNSHNLCRPNILIEFELWLLIKTVF